jgi:hypothetical protein
MILLFVISQIIALLAACLDYLFNDRRTTVYKRTRVVLIIALIISLCWGTFKMNQEEDNNINEKNLQNAKIKELKDSLFSLNQNVQYTGVNTLSALEKQKTTLSKRIDYEGNLLISELRNKAKATKSALDNLKEASLQATVDVKHDVKKMKNLIYFDKVKFHGSFHLDKKSLQSLREFKYLYGKYGTFTINLDLYQGNSYVRLIVIEDKVNDIFLDCALQNTEYEKGKACLFDSTLSFSNYKVHMGGSYGKQIGFLKNEPIEVEAFFFITTNTIACHMKPKEIFLYFDTGEYMWENKFTILNDRHIESFIGKLKPTLQ